MYVDLLTNQLLVEHAPVGETVEADVLAEIHTLRALSLDGIHQTRVATADREVLKVHEIAHGGRLEIRALGMLRQHDHDTERLMALDSGSDASCDRSCNLVLHEVLSSERADEELVLNVEKVLGVRDRLKVLVMNRTLLECHPYTMDGMMDQRPTRLAAGV